jgi:malate dehydrogenase (oxaloacetate-decarboxylating)
MHDDVTFRIRMPHRPGTLSKIAAAIGRAGAVIGDLTTIHTDSRYSLRDVTIEQSHVDVQALAKDIEACVEGIRVEILPDRARKWHEGGKLRLVPARPVTTIAEMRLAYTPGVARICTEVAEDERRSGS